MLNLKPRYRISSSVSAQISLASYFAKPKASQFNIFILTMDLMTMCNVKVVSYSEKPTENYHSPAVQLGSKLHFSIF